jgi:hypothetical protein
MINRDVYEKDPGQNRLLNQGVAKVTSGPTDPELETLRFEITNFVCDGQYAEGLKRVLSTYLTTLDLPEQPGVWVSGFYGSGKSHLVKMLQHLWIDFEFPDGARARGLARLPQDIKDHLTELSTQAKRRGGLHAAAGTLGTGAGDSVRLELLGLIFKSVGLPEHYPSASFLIWLRREGMEDAVKQHIAAAGRDFELELSNLYVSDAIARAILAARSGFAGSPGEVKHLIESQYPEKADVSIEEMISKIKQAVGTKNKLPCLLIVLDEVQQYVGDSPDRSKDIQDLQEQCCSHLGANVLFVATGQNALSGTALLQRLQGRFPVTVELQDADVERVTREVVLKKKPSAEPVIRSLLEAHSGEIERHLSSTNIAFTARDRQLLVQDYPLLPVRRRFWERVLRAVDKAGTGAQLRTQLWIVYDAAQKTAELPLGNVVDAAFIFEHIKTKVIQSGVRLQEIAETIARQRQEEDGELRYRLCALIFLIGQLPREGPADAGIRANAETLADLLVTDLTVGSAELRKRVSALLELLVAVGAVMRVEDEYRMQTREGAEWNQAYLGSRNALLNDSGKLASERSQLLKTHCSDMLSKRKLLHGESKEDFKFELHFGADPRATGGAAFPVWIRDGWEFEEKTVLADARKAGENAAVVFGHIPRKRTEELKQAIASHYAAKTTFDTRGTPTTPEGIEARKAMETMLEQAERNRDQLLEDLLNETTIWIAGGGDPVPGILLENKVQDAAKACIDRLYHRFHEADSPDWHKVIERSKKGDGDALEAIGHKGDPDTHPVSAAILGFVGSGKKGTEVRKQFASPPYGWPQDAVDGALIVLANAGSLQARSGGEAVAKGKLDQKSIATTEFRVENVTVSKVQLIQIRGVFQKVGLHVAPGQESVKVGEFLSRMNARAEGVGGEAPLPKRPDTAHLDDIAQRVGNDQLKAIHDHLARLTKEAAEWQSRQEAIAQREPRWRHLKALLGQAADLPVEASVRGEVQAIEANRSLLADPDPVPGLVETLTQALREAINQAHARCGLLIEEGRAALDASPTWGSLSDVQRASIQPARARVLDSTAGLRCHQERRLARGRGPAGDVLGLAGQEPARRPGRCRRPEPRRLDRPAA